jgi:hypothetical protein
MDKMGKLERKIGRVKWILKLKMGFILRGPLFTKLRMDLKTWCL